MAVRRLRVTIRYEGYSRQVVILRYAGKDATAAYDEIHAPGILEESLSSDNFKGLLDQSEVVILPEEQKEDIDKIEKTRGQSTSTETYTKPDLFKLISTHDFGDVAKKTLTTKAWAFYSSAATDLVTHHANSNFYRRIMLRPRVMRDVTEANPRRSILGCPSTAPFFVAPAAMARLAHPDGECAIARGCASEGLIQCVSSPLKRNFTHCDALLTSTDLKQRFLPSSKHNRIRYIHPSLLPPALRQRRPPQNNATPAQSALPRHQSHLRNRRRPRPRKA